MNTKYLNVILVVAIALVIGGIGFFGWRLYSTGSLPLGIGKTGAPAGIKIPAPTPITNKGKESEDRDAALQRDVRAINDAVVAYAKDHKGKYPESDFKNPCSGARYCLKGSDINTREKIYLAAVPQVQPSRLDYYYHADNQKKTFCIFTPNTLETVAGKLFQCTEKVCDLVSPADMCR